MKPRIVMHAVLAACLALALWPCAAVADDTDPQGSRLKAYVEQRLEEAPPNDRNAALVQAQGGTSADDYRLLCGLEIGGTLTIGYIIWYARMANDQWYGERGEVSAEMSNVYRYCLLYSTTCDHWTWSPTCLAERR